LRSLLPDATVECIGILLVMLAYDPDERITAKETLRHVFFKDVVTDEKEKLLSQSKEKLLQLQKDIEVYPIY
jgi:hypothetical protein